MDYMYPVQWPLHFVIFLLYLQLPFLCGLPFLERRASQTAHLVAGMSGKHLFLMDKNDGKPPLLLRMVNDSEDLKFMLVSIYPQHWSVDQIALNSKNLIVTISSNLWLMTCVDQLYVHSKGVWLMQMQIMTVSSFVFKTAFGFWMLCLNISSYLCFLYDLMSTLTCHKDMVGWRTSSIRRQNELPKVRFEFWSYIHSNALLFPLICTCFI